MEDLTEFQQNWKQIKPAEDWLPAKDLKSQFKAIYDKTEKERKYLLKTFIGTAVFISATIFLLPTLPYIAGIVMINLAMLIIYSLTKANQESINTAHFGAEGSEFIQQNIDFLNRRRAITATYMPLYAVLLIGGLNLGYITILSLFELTITQRILIHILGSLLMGTGFYFSIKNHLKQFDIKAKPILAHFEKLLEDIKT